MASHSEMLNERLNLYEETKKMLEKRTDEEGTIDDEDAMRIEKNLSALENLNAQIRSFESQARANGYYMENKPILENPMNAVYNKILASEKISNDFQLEDIGEKRMNITQRPRMGKNYSVAFSDAIRKNFRGELQNYLQEGIQQDGGFLVPDEMHAEIVTLLKEENILRQIGQTLQTKGSHKIPLSSALSSAQWVSEGGEIDLNDIHFSQVTIGAHKLATAVECTNELLQDSYYDLEDFLQREFAKAVGRAEEYKMISGTGNGEIKGILPTLIENFNTCIIQTAGSSIAADDLINVVYKLESSYRKNACWLMNDSTLAIIRKLKDGNQAYIWQQSLSLDEPPSLCGYPVYTSSYMPAPTSGNVPIIFGNFKDFFLIGDRGTRIFKPLYELKALSDKSVFMMIERVDSAITQPAAFRALKIKNS